MFWLFGWFFILPVSPQSTTFLNSKSVTEATGVQELTCWHNTLGKLLDDYKEGGVLTT